MRFIFEKHFQVLSSFVFCLFYFIFLICHVVWDNLKIFVNKIFMLPLSVTSTCTITSHFTKENTLAISYIVLVGCGFFFPI